MRRKKLCNEDTKEVKERERVTRIFDMVKHFRFGIPASLFPPKEILREVRKALSKDRKDVLENVNLPVEEGQIRLVKRARVFLLILLRARVSSLPTSYQTEDFVCVQLHHFKELAHDRDVPITRNLYAEAWLPYCLSSNLLEQDSLLIGYLPDKIFEKVRDEALFFFSPSCK